MLRYVEVCIVPKVVPGVCNEAKTASLSAFKSVELQLGVLGFPQSVFTTYRPSIRQSSPPVKFAQPRFTTPPFQFCQTVALVTVIFEFHIFRESSPVRTNTFDALAPWPN